MYKCNDCGVIGEGVNHNGRGLRCTHCFSDNLEAVTIKPEKKPTTPAKPARKRKAVK